MLPDFNTELTFVEAYRSKGERHSVKYITPSTQTIFYYLHKTPISCYGMKLKLNTYVHERFPLTLELE